MIPSIAPLHAIIVLNTGLVRNAVDGVDDAKALVRPLDGANSAAFLFAHVIGARHLMASVAGAPLPNPIDRYITARQSIDEITEWPTMAEMHAAWSAVSSALENAMSALTVKVAATPTAYKFPIPDNSVGGILTFFTQHDSYHLGQLSMLRKSLVGAAMSYVIA